MTSIHFNGKGYVNPHLKINIKYIPKFLLKHVDKNSKLYPKYFRIIQFSVK